MYFIIPYGIVPSSPNPLLTRDQDALMYRAHLETSWIVMLTLQLWEVLYGESGRYARECIASELDHALIDHFETHARLEDYNERMAAHAAVDRHHTEFIQAIHDVYQKLLPYLGMIPSCINENVLESFNVLPHGNTAMAIEMKYQLLDRERL